MAGFGWDLWTSRPRLLGLAPIAAGVVGALATPAPDLLLTGDGRHLAIVHNGVPHLLRDRAGDYVRSLIAEVSAFDGDPAPLEGAATGACSRDACVTRIERGGRSWQILATRTSQRIDWVPLTRACAEADIVISDRWLPRGCTPKWLKLDRDALAKTGGVAIYLEGQPRVETVAERVEGHPWAS